MLKRSTTLGIAGVLALGGAGLLGAKAEVTIPAGTQIVGVLQQTVSTKQNEVGDRVVIKTDEPLALGGGASIPSGMLVSGEITRAKSGGRLGGSPSLTIRFDRLELSGRSFTIATVPFRVKGKSSTSTTAKQIGGGAVVGGVIGAVAGNTVKGAAIGAILGTGVAVATDGKDLELPAGRKLQVQLTESVSVQY